MTSLDRINKVLDDQYAKAKIVSDVLVPVLKSFANCTVSGPFSRDMTVSLGYITLATFDNASAASDSFQDILNRYTDILISLMPEDNREHVEIVQKNCTIGIALIRRIF